MQVLTCCLLLVAIGINKNQKIAGIPLEQFSAEQSEVPVHDWTTKTGDRVISTQYIARDIWGYGGNIPLYIYLKNNTIDRIEVQSNAESPEFLASVVDKGLLAAWNGLTPEEAIARPVDAITGATLSSNAIIASVEKAMQYAAGQVTTDRTVHWEWKNVRFWIVLVIVLSGIFIPLFYKNNYFRMGQLLLNVIVLGFWSGNFISLSLLVNYLSNGVNVWMSVIPLLLLVAAFLLPLLGKSNHYCLWLCPLGSCQELIGKIIPYKAKLTPDMIRNLSDFRNGLWLVIMMVMWFGVGFELLDYELFSAFMFRQAAVPLIIVALLFALLSGFIQHPYCRFVCPTGSLIKFSQQTSNKLN